MTNLDEAYSNRDFIPDADSYPPRWADAAAAYRAAQAGERGVSYGPSDRQCLDTFEPAEPKGTLVFVHGGYWRMFDNQSWSHLAAGVVGRGWRVAMPAYDLCPSVSIATITQQIARAVTLVADKTEGPISLAGHSAGGHLVSRMLAPGMLHKHVADRISHVMPISPLSDLEPLTQTSMNADFGLDKAMAQAESPLRQPKPEVPVTVWVGSAERPVFLDQAMWLASHWQCDEVIAPDMHHFNVIDPLTDPQSDMVRRLTEAL